MFVRRSSRRGRRTLRLLATANIATELRYLPSWQCWFQPAFRKALDALISRGDLAIERAEALEDVGQEFMRASQRIFAERERRGIPLPAGPGDRPDWGTNDAETA